MDASYAFTPRFFGPTGDIQALLAEKLRESPTAAAGNPHDALVVLSAVGDIWIRRNDAVQGHAMLNQAAVALAWRLRQCGVHAAREVALSPEPCLAWLPDGWPARPLPCSVRATSIDSPAAQAVIDALA